MEPILYLILGHYLADFPLQGEFLANFKGKNNYILACHVLIYSLFIACILQFLGIFAIWKLILLVVSHTLIDYWKCHWTKLNPLTTALYIDQFLHISILFLFV